jgi:hypothetical protein
MHNSTDSRQISHVAQYQGSRKEDPDGNDFANVELSLNGGSANTSGHDTLLTVISI